MKKVYIAHPLRGADREKNVAEVTRICQKITELFPDVLPISPIHAFSFLDNCGEGGEKKALELCLEMLKNCDEAWFFGNWQNSVGCRAEYDAACSRSYIKRFVYSFQECERYLSEFAESPPDKGSKSELARWLLEEVYEPEIKPCPFCGGKAQIADVPGVGGSVFCAAPDCAASVWATWGKEKQSKTRAEAVAAWNRRAGE